MKGESLEKLSKPAALALLIAAAVLVFATGIPRFGLVTELPPFETAMIPGSRPAVCSGYNPEKDRFGYEYQACPKGYAFYAVDDPAGVSGPGSIIATTENCCPLPNPDILTDEHVFAETSCPENYVATGAKDLHCGENCKKYLRCTKINSGRYRLGEMKPALYWGDGYAGWQGSQQIDKTLIPPAIRTSVGRLDADHWDGDGCVGFPWGSLLAGKETKYCSGLYFRQLLFNGLPGDPPAGTAVRMFPEHISAAAQ